MNRYHTGLFALTLLCLTQIGCAQCMYRMNCGYGCASCGVPECGCPEPGCACPEPGCACPEPGCACPEPGCACPGPSCYMPVGCGSCVSGCPILQECPILGRVGRCLGTMFGCDCCGGCDCCCEAPCSQCAVGGYSDANSYIEDPAPQVATRPVRLSRARRNVAQDLRSADIEGPRFR